MVPRGRGSGPAGDNLIEGSGQGRLELEIRKVDDQHARVPRDARQPVRPTVDTGGQAASGTREPLTLP
jgi:hypothetical protein